MAVKKLNDQQLRTERMKYNLLVQSQIASLDFNENIDKKVIKFFLFTVVIGIGFAWLSSTPSDSNIYRVYNTIKTRIPYGEVLLKFQFPILVLIGVLCLKIYAMKKKVTKLVFNSLLSYSKQDDLFKSFIKRMIADKEKVNIEDEDNITDLCDIIKNRDIYDICFDKIDFEDYLKVHFKNHLDKFPLFFLSNFAYLILYNECLENTLVHGSDNGEYEFTLIISKNYTIL